MTERPGGRPDSTGSRANESRANQSGAEDSHAEEVLAQALRVMAGGGKAPGPTGGSPDARTRRRLSTAQLVLLAAIVGLLIGIGAGFGSLML